MAAGVVTSSPVTTRRELARLPFIDGIRAVAASLVAVQHLAYFVPGFNRPGSWWQVSPLHMLLWPAKWGHEMVALFLVVSGFSLYYSEMVRRGRGSSTPVSVFARRRAWRIGPTYYAALLFGLLAVPAITALAPQAAGLPPNVTHITAGGVVSHLFFLHNVQLGWTFQGNAPLWSMAYEVQLYLLFPLLVWAFTRRPWVTIGAALVAQAAIDRSGIHVFGLIEWFALGCLLAELVARGVRPSQRLLVAGGLLLLAIAEVGPPHFIRPVHDLAWGGAFAALILAMAQTPDSRWNPLGWKPLRWLGIRSYSLYVVNFPIALLMLGLLERAGLSGTGLVLTMLFAGGAVVLAVTVASYQWIERPSLARARAAGSNVLPA